jgi:hypothetical protein
MGWWRDAVVVLVVVLPTSLSNGAFNQRTKSYVGQAVLEKAVLARTDAANKGVFTENEPIDSLKIPGEKNPKRGRGRRRLRDAKERVCRTTLC